MRWAILTCLGLVAASPGPDIDRLIDFQQYRFGLPPTEFNYDATGPYGPVLSAGRPLWRTHVDLFAPSPKLALIQASALAQDDHYPIAIVRDLTAEKLKLAVGFKLLGGDRSRSAGVLCRAQDKANYDAVLVSALRQEVRLLRMTHARPVELAKAKATFDAQGWNFLEVSAQGDLTRVWLNDRLVLETPEGRPTASGRIGLITHADTIAVFDDFYIQSGAGRVVRKAPLAPALAAPLHMRVADFGLTDADYKTPRTAFKRGGRIYWQVCVVDQDQKPVSAAVVECDLTHPAGDVFTTEKAVTGTDGTALFSHLLSAEDTTGDYTVRVKTITHSNLSDATYTPAANGKSAAQFEVR
jgi:hypothetical protein